MTLEYLLLFALGLAVATALTGMGDHVVQFVIEQVRTLTARA
jgi:hypothetical protein